MFKKELTHILSKLKYDNFNQEDSIKLIYMFKVWKVLSQSQIIDKENLFDKNIADNYTIDKVLRVFSELESQFDIFELFNNSINLNKLSNESLALIIEFIVYQKFLNSYDVLVDFLGDKGYFISSQISHFALKLLNTNYTELYAPFKESYQIAYHTDKKVFAESHEDGLTIKIIKILDNLNIKYERTDVLEQPTYIKDNKLRQFDCTVAFPPFASKGKSEIFRHDIYNRFKIYQGKGLLDVAYFEHILATTKRKAVVLMAAGFTFRGGVEEKFRQSLIENNYLEAVVELPSNILNRTGILSTFFIINKEKNNNNVYFLDLKDKQFISKKGRKYILNNIDEIIEIYKDCKEIENISSIVSNNEISKNNYSLSISRYIYSKKDLKIQNMLNNYKKISLQKITSINKSPVIKNEEDGEAIYEITPSDFKTFGFTLECGKIKYTKQSAIHTLTPNDILISMKGTVGKIAIIGKLQKQMIASPNIQIIRIEKKSIIEPIVLYMFLKSNIGQSLLKQLSTGTTMPQITTKEIKALEIPILEKTKQEEIIKNFDDEVKLFREIELIKQKIHKINNNFLGDFKNE
jgi:type I restriction enzyme M protein